MRLLILFLSLLFSVVLSAQNDILAKEYFSKGQFEKAAIAYEGLLASNPNNSVYFSSLLSCYQELKQFEKAEKIISDRMKRTRQPNLNVELGYNYQLQGNAQKAKEFYQKARDAVEENPNNAGGVAYLFEQKNLLQEALEIYEMASEKNDRLNYEYQKGRIYGQLGNLEMMIDSFLEYSYTNRNFTVSIQNQFYLFMLDDASDSFSDLLRKSLLVKAQKTQDIYWNEFLSWFFVQQKQYDRAFAQEKAIYRRNDEGLSSILNLANLTVEEEDYILAKEIFDFVLENAQDRETQIAVKTMLVEIKIQTSDPKEYPKIKTELENLLDEFGKNTNTIDLQLLHAHFIGFNLDNPQEAQQILKGLLNLNINTFGKAKIKMELADMLLYEEKFNQALIYYSQVENDVKNHEVAHQASLKVAKTSYYKGDFPWALKQLSVLKTSFSQLIANDALDLYLLINDTNANDSTYTALKKFAKADFLLYKQKDTEALEQFKLILKEHKDEDIEPVTLLRVGEILEKQGYFEEALKQYSTIIEHFSDGIYIDEALFFSAEIYNKHLANPEKAKELYEKIIFNHQDSIYFIDARKEFRILRGDNV